MRVPPEGPDAERALKVKLRDRATPTDDEITRGCSELLEAHPQGLRETKTLLARDILARIDEQAEEMLTVGISLMPR